MSTAEDRGLAAGAGRWWWRARWVPLRVVAGLVVFIGVVAAVGGVARDVAAATRAPGPVGVPVSLRVHELDRLRVLTATGPGARTLVPFRLQRGVEQPGLQLWVGAGRDSWIEPGARPFVFNTVGSTVAEQLLAGGGAAVFGVCLAWGALLARRLLLSVGGGQPFQRRNAARVAVIAALIVAATVAGSLLPYLAARLVLGRVGLGGPGSPVYAQFTMPATPLLLALLILALAEAFRRGTRLARDADGLV